MRITHLKIKIKTLAAEAAIIRKEANKVSGYEKYELKFHKVTIVRWHARHNQLAYALLRNVSYTSLEARCHEPPDLVEIDKIAKRFSNHSPEDLVWSGWRRQWFIEAQTHLEKQGHRYIKKIVILDKKETETA